MKTNTAHTTTARLLAGLLALHLLILRPPTTLLLPVIAVLLFGEIFRVRQIFMPVRWNALWVGAGLTAIMILGLGMRPAFLIGALAGMAGATAIFSRVTPLRGLWVLCCLLLLLLMIVLTPFIDVGVLTVIGDVVILYLMAERVRQPPEVEMSFWRSLLRALRVVVPVALVVSTVFWIFPNLSYEPPASFSGFSGRGDLSPGRIASLAQSRRVALVAHFPEENPLPSGTDLYWRGQVLNRNAGLYWSEEKGRIEQDRTLQETPPGPGFAGWSYQIDLTGNYGGVVPVLDHAVFLKAERAGIEVAVFDRGGAELRAVGRGSLAIAAMSSPDPMTDAPLPALAEGDLAGPKDEAPDAAVTALAGKLFRPGRTLTSHLEALAEYFRLGGFSYSLRPGRMESLSKFLFESRQGFCGHFAAASANLLRAGGVPARIVTGYRGGQWNPWLRTLTVRDSDAHAWVEAWDERGGVWRRFDPTDAVAPGERERINRNMEPGSWPWYRRGWSYGQARVTVISEEIKAAFARVMSSDLRESVQPFLAVLLLLLLVVWWMRHRRRRTNGWILEEIERRAADTPRARRPGETPLGWLERLRNETDTVSEKAALDELARAHEAALYRAGEPIPPSERRRAARHLLRLWRTLPPRSGW